MLAALLALSLDIAQLLHRDVIAGERICDAAELRTFYARRDHRPAWDERTSTALLRAIDALADEGLEPDRYHREALHRLAAGAERDVLATDAFLTAAAHLSRGVCDPRLRGLRGARCRWIDAAAVADGAR
jgi:hypothetical protein